jgi:hypothetical protein
MELDNQYIKIILNILFILVIIYIFYCIISNYKVSYVQSSRDVSKFQNKIQSLEKKISDLESSIDNNENINVSTTNPVPPINPIIEFDRRKLLDPFIDPSTRPPASQVPTPEIASITNIATQNIYDSYHRVGLLIEENKSENSTNDDNSILELMGRLLYHNFYQYFTSITMGNKVIKIDIKRENGQEFFNGDKVFIPELNRHYIVKVDKRDMIYYNPYFPNPI